MSNSLPSESGLLFIHAYATILEKYSALLFFKKMFIIIFVEKMEFYWTSFESREALIALVTYSISVGFETE